MDTISTRENNSMLPLAGVIVGVVALLLGLYAAVSLGHVKAQLKDHEDKLAQLPDIASQASAAGQKADSANSRVDQLQTGTQTAFNSVAAELGNEKAEIAKLEDSMKHPVAGGHGHGHGSAVAGPGEYIVKSGDTGRKIARANGCSLHELEEVNPGVNWSRLHLGQKIKLPEKGEAPAPAPAAPAAAQPTT